MTVPCYHKTYAHHSPRIKQLNEINSFYMFIKLIGCFKTKSGDRRSQIYQHRSVRFRGNNANILPRSSGFRCPELILPESAQQIKRKLIEITWQ